MTSRTLNKLTLRQAQSAGAGTHRDGGGLSLWVNEEGRSRSWVFRFTLPFRSARGQVGLFTP